MPELNTLQTGKSLILSNIVRSYINEDYIAEHIFKPIHVTGNTVSIPRWDHQRFIRRQTGRAPYANANVLTSSQPEHISFSLSEEEVTILIDKREGDVSSINLQKNKSKEAKEAILISNECKAAEIIQSESRYGVDNKISLSSPSDKFSDLNNSDPLGVIEDAKKAVREKIGKKPNSIVLNYDVWETLKKHQQFAEFRGKGAGDADPLKACFELENIYIGSARCCDMRGKFTDIWNSNIAVFYQPETDLTEAPHFCAGFRRKGYPSISKFWKDNSQKVLAIQYTDLLSYQLLCPEAGYLISDTLS